MNKYRKFVTSGVGFTFVVVGVTGVIFKFFFKNHVLEQIHGWLGIAMVIAAVFHIVQNWASLRNHLRDWRVLTLVVPILLVAIFFSISQREQDGDGINPRAIVHKLFNGNAGDVAKAFGKNVNSVFALMKNDGLHVESGDESIQELARLNQKSPETVLAYFAK